MRALESLAKERDIKIDVLIEAIVAGNDRKAVEETTEYLSGLVPEA